MTVKNMLIALVIVSLSLFFVPYSIVVLVVILFSFIFSIYQKNKEIHDDLRKIKRHLGLLSKEELEIVEINEELAYHREIENSPQKIDELNSKIEEELASDREDTGDDGNIVNDDSKKNG